MKEEGARQVFFSCLLLLASLAAQSFLLLPTVSPPVQRSNRRHYCGNAPLNFADGGEPDLALFGYRAAHVIWPWTGSMHFCAARIDDIASTSTSTSTPLSASDQGATRRIRTRKFLVLEVNGILEDKCSASDGALLQHWFE